ncbi:unnamed protein product [Phytomonas sp. EM1]|nr:unnamed protein product [Phytomonas sp. EM1]|eukprot:CCW63496.1 unnamed protein product [Phytomonas sp. isolate EM1]
MHEALRLAERSRQKEKNALLGELQRLERRYEPTVRGLHSDLETYRRKTQSERHSHEEALQEKQARVEALEAALRREKLLRKRAEERHRLEMEGVQSELDLMRQSLRQMEKKVFFRNALEEAAASAEQPPIEDYHFRY